MKFSPQLERKQAWGAVADWLAVDLYHRHDEVRRRCDEGLPRALGFLDAEGTLDEFDPLSLQEVDERGAGDAAQDGVVDLPRHQPTLTVDDPGGRCCSLRDVAAGIDKPSLLGPLRAGRLLGKGGWQQHYGFDVAPSPARVGHGLDGNADRRRCLEPRKRHRPRQAHDGGDHAIRREQKVARPRTARHLQIDEAVAHAIAPDRLAHDARPGARRHGGDAQLIERAGQALHMPRFVDEAPASHFAHLIDGIADLEPAILGVHHGVRIGAISSIDVDDARHVPVLGKSPARSCELTPSARSLRCSAERSMPTNSAVREILPPKRLICASKYSRSKISRASRKGSDIKCSAPPLTGSGTLEPISSGSMLAVMTASGSPPDRINSRSMLLRSSRTLPGQSCACRTAMASSPMRRGDSPEDCATCCTKCWISNGMSSRRSARPGTRSGTTLSR